MAVPGRERLFANRSVENILTVARHDPGMTVPGPGRVKTPEPPVRQDRLELVPL